MEQQVKCDFSVINWSDHGDIYSCNIKNQEIGSKSTWKFVGFHNFWKNNNDVLGVSFKDCKIRNFPKGLTKDFPNLQYLEILNSGLINISHDDLKEYKNLKVLFLNNNEISYLSGDIFQDLKELERLCACDSKIEIIEPNIFENCNNLKHVDLKLNICINKCFSLIFPSSQTATLEEIKEELKNIYPSWAEKVKNFKGEITSEILKLIREKTESGRKIEELQHYKNVMEQEELKDFTIKTKSEEFKAHKFVLAAHSPTFAKLISQNVHTESLNLLDVSTDVFRAILHFMYTNEFPENNQINFIELFIASEKLKIERLKKIAAEKLLNEINAENALEILKLGIKYNQKKLRKKSFEEIKKFLVIEEIDENLEFEAEKLKVLIEVKKEKDRMMKEYEESVKNVLEQK